MRRLTLALAVLLLAGCTALAPSADPTPTAAGFPKPKIAASVPAVLCSDPSLSGSATYTFADGLWFETGIIGEGHTVAVFVPQSGADYCGFTDFAVELAGRGIQSVLLNLCHVGQTTCDEQNVVRSGADAVLAAAEQARSSGATRVVAVGASMGGTTAIVASEIAGTDGRLDAVADLSGPIHFAGIDSSAEAGKIAIPMFLAVGDRDQVVSDFQMKQLGDASGSPQWAQYSGFGHGWDLLFLGGALTDTGSRLVDFIAG